MQDQPYLVIPQWSNGIDKHNQAQQFELGITVTDAWKDYLLFSRC